MFYSMNVVSYAGTNASNVGTAIGCTVSSDGSQMCTPTTPNANILPTAGVFGDFLDALNMIITIGKGVFLPYFLLLQFGVNATIAGIYNFAMMMCWAALIIYVVGNRDVTSIF